MIFSRTYLFRGLYRNFSVTRRVFDNESSKALREVSHHQEEPTRKTGGRAKWGLVGLLLGVTASGAYGYNFLFNEQATHDTLISSDLKKIEELTREVRDYCRAIEDLKQEIIVLKSATATRSNIDEFRKLISEVYSQTTKDVLAVKARIHDLENDLINFIEQNQKKMVKSSARTDDQ